MLTLVIGQVLLPFSGRLGHWRDERPDGLGMAGDRSQPERRRDLADQQVAGQQPAGGCTPEPRDQTARTFLQPMRFEQADHRQNDPDHRDIAGIIKSLTEGRDDGVEIEPGREPGNRRCRDNDQQRIEAQHEAQHHHRDAGKHQHLAHP